MTLQHPSQLQAEDGRGVNVDDLAAQRLGQFRFLALREHLVGMGAQRQSGAQGQQSLLAGPGGQVGHCLCGEQVAVRTQRAVVLARGVA